MGTEPDVTLRTTLKTVSPAVCIAGTRRGPFQACRKVRSQHLREDVTGPSQQRQGRRRADLRHGLDGNGSIPAAVEQVAVKLGVYKRVDRIGVGVEVVRGAEGRARRLPCDLLLVYLFLEHLGAAGPREH
eukprot:scaffold619_cov403-Prasinococcus_capsulatus_cf.AAC.15